MSTADLVGSHQRHGDSTQEFGGEFEARHRPVQRHLDTATQYRDVGDDQVRHLPSWFPERLNQPPQRQTIRRPATIKSL